MGAGLQRAFAAARATRWWLKLAPGTVLVCPATGRKSVVKWQSGGHVQFEGGRSCATRDIPSFYSRPKDA